MARLPDETALGSLPSAASGRSVATFDVTGYARGAAARARGAAAIAGGVEDIGKGLQVAGKSVGDVATYQQNHLDELDLAKAQSNYLIQTKQIRDKLSGETDPSKLTDTYAPQFQQAQSDSAALISNPRARELWTLKTAPDVTGHVITIGDKETELHKSNELAGAQTRLDQIRQSALQTNDPAARAEFIQSGHQLIGGLQEAGYIDAVAAQKFRTKWTQDYAVGAVSIMPPEEQVKVLSSSVQGRDATLDRIGGIENATGNPAARSSTSSAMGNFQFTNQTWLDTIAAHRPDLLQNRNPQTVLDLRADPKLSREMAGYLLDDNAAVLRSQGISATPSNLYLAHFLGASDAAKVLKAAPGTPISDVVNPASIEANKSVLAGKTTDTVMAWSASKMGGSLKGRGDLIDFIPEDQRIDMLHKATETVAANGIDGARRTQLETQQIKDKSDAAENEMLKDLYSDNPKTTARSIVSDDRLTREAKERMIVKAQQALSDANSKADKTYGAGFYDVYQKVHAPEGSPGRITDPTELYSRVGPNGDLTVAGVDKLVAEIQGRRTPEGVSEGEMKAQFFKTAKAQISGSDEGLHIHDPKGDQLYLRFMATALPAYEAGKKAGKSAVQLLNPDSPDYVGKSIDTFKRPMDQWFGDVVQDSPVHKGEPATAFDIKTVKSLDDLVVAYRSGKVPKAQADQLAIDRGWAAKKVPSSAPQVPVSSDNSSPSNLQAADAALKLTTQEKALYQRHLDNLSGPGGVDNPPDAQGRVSRSTLFQTTIEHDGKFYTVPTVWNGKILVDRDASGKFAGISKEGLANVKQEGWDKFPSYKTEAEAEARYQKMHDFMERDTGEYFSRKRASQ